MIDSDFVLSPESGKRYCFSTELPEGGVEKLNDVLQGLAMRVRQAFITLWGLHGLFAYFAAYSLFVYRDDKFSSYGTEVARILIRQMQAEEIANSVAAGLPLDRSPPTVKAVN